MLELICRHVHMYIYIYIHIHEYVYTIYVYAHAYIYKNMRAPLHIVTYLFMPVSVSAKAGSPSHVHPTSPLRACT